jgi:alpha-methylacyl-CoA racemase
VSRQGPLAGIKVVELAGLGPAPFACMVLADLGADVLRIDRPGGGNPRRPAEAELLNRGRPCAAVDLKNEQGRMLVARLAAQADVFVEGFRPGVAERLGLGPAELCQANPRLVYARMTGWGQDGPRAQAVGHDINYAAIAGALGAIGTLDKPVAPLNLVSDFGGGAMLLVAGVLAALVERSTSGQGQVIDAAMVDGTALLLAMTFGFRAAGVWRDQRASNILDGGAPFYDTYACADGGFVAVGAIEPPFYAALLEGLHQVAPDDVASLPDQMDQEAWPRAKAVLAGIFSRHRREYWTKHFEGTDACVTPVLTLAEATRDAHLAARATYIDGPCSSEQPAPAPRFSRTPPGPPTPASRAGADTVTALRDWNVSASEVQSLLADGVVQQS